MDELKSIHWVPPMSLVTCAAVGVHALVRAPRFRPCGLAPTDSRANAGNGPPSSSSWLGDGRRKGRSWPAVGGGRAERGGAGSGLGASLVAMETAGSASGWSLEVPAPMEPRGAPLVGELGPESGPGPEPGPQPDVEPSFRVGDYAESPDPGPEPEPEPRMLRLRPASEQTQDISHVLTRLFKNLYTLDVIGEDIGANLIKSRGGENVRHLKFVDELQKLRDNYAQKLADADMVERHIIQGRARALAEEERLLNNIKAQGFGDIHLPPVDSVFRWCVDNELLKKNNLICPEDYIHDPPPFSQAPKGEVITECHKTTFSSRQHSIAVEKAHKLIMKGCKKLPAISSQVSLSSLSKYSTLQKEPVIIVKKPKRPKNKMWMNHLNTARRVQERQLLARFEDQYKYLKNPRFYPPNTADGGKSLLFPLKKTGPLGDEHSVEFSERNFNDAPVFLAKPSVVFFTDYVVGPVYEVVLELQNITSASRHLRILPPSTQFFSLSLGKFPSKGGLVAPGMVCQFTIRFAPDSLGDFDDFILVETQAVHTLLIPLQARRPPPILTLAPVLHCGYCLVGGIKITGFICKNVGLSKGRFCIMPKSSWPPPSFRAVATVGFVDQAPFNILPPVFELIPGQSLLLEVVFFPVSLETVEKSFIIVCDNCQTKEVIVSGTGQLAALGLLWVSGEVSYPEPGELTDLTAQHFIRFEAQNIQTTSSKHFIVRNITHVELPFHWQIMKPNLLPLMPGEIWSYRDIKYYPDPETAFYVTPRKGVLQPHSDHEFILSFSPEQLKDYHSVIQIVLEEIPDPICLAMENSRESPHNMDDVIALEIEVKGSVEPFQVLLEPYAIIIPGENYIRVNVRKGFKMWNNSRSAIRYRWGKICDCHIIEVEPCTGVIEPNEKGEFELSFTGGVPGNTSQELLCKIDRSPVPVVLHIEATFKGPTLSIDVSALQFGLIRLGKKAVCFINIHNTSQLLAKWKMQESQSCLEERKEKVSPFKIEPSEGHISPLGEVHVTVLFEAKCCQSLQTVLELLVENGEPSYLPVYAEVQRPYVYLMSSQLVLSNMYFGIPFEATITLFNGTLLPTKFEWGKLLGTYSDLCLVEISPQHGLLGPNEEKQLRLHFTSFTMDELTDLVLPCQIEGMKKSLVLGISGKPKGLDVTFSIPQARSKSSEDPEREDLYLEFGSNIPLRSLLRQQLVLTNNSAIKASFSLEFDYYGVSDEVWSKKTKLPDVPPAMSHSVRIAKHVARKDLIDTLETLLSKGKGAAFFPHISQGTLDAFQKLTIDISACSNMWGDYQDQLICKVEDLPLTIIQVHMGVVGCPITLFRTSLLAGDPPQNHVIRFGTQISGGDTISRTLRLNNTSPYDIRIDWETYNPEEREDRLVDLKVVYGTPFPQRDAAGVEIDSKSEPMSDTSLGPSFSQSSLSLGSGNTLEAQHGTRTTASEEDTSQFTAHGKPKVISVILEPHEGVRAEEPYSITPKQLVIPAGGSNFINISFTPMVLAGPVNKMACHSYALGFMSLDSRIAREIPGKVKRPQNYEADILRLDLHALVRPTRLSIEYDYDGRMVFHLQASDLIPADPLTGVLTKIVTTRHLKLSNPMEVTHCFGLLVALPFSVTGINPKANRRALDREEFYLEPAGDQFILGPQQNMLLEVSFSLSLELLTYQKLPSDQMLPGVEIIQDKDGAKRMEFSQELVLEFINGTTQVVPLLAIVAVPALQLSTSWVDFGTCFVSETHTREVTLLNMSRCKSHWMALLDQQERQKAIFHVYPTSGVLEARQVNSPPTSIRLNIHFTASDSGEFEAIVTVDGVLGEACLVHVCGKGSYDEKY